MMEKNVNAWDLFLQQRRFDLIFKYLYVKNPCEYNKKAYIENIRAFNGFKENSSNGVVKKTSSDFVETYDEIIKSIESEGFDSSKSKVQVNENGELMDGAHRLCVCACTGKDIMYEKCDLHAKWDYTYFRAKQMDESVMDYGALEYVKLNPNAYIVNIMPVNNLEKDEKVVSILEKFGFVYYKKDVWVTYNGLVNLKKVSYGSFWEGAKWIGDISNEFEGARNHANNSMGRNPLRVFVFVCDDINKVVKAKKEIREIYKIGNYSVHINDTHEEAIQLAETYFNSNSLFMTNTRPFMLEDNEFDEHIEILKKACEENNIKTDRVCGAGSTPMNVFQIRHSQDLDYLSLDVDILPDNEIISTHNKYTHIYPYPISEIIEDPNNFMYYKGIKFISLDVLYLMKSKRREIPKDIFDLQKIRTILYYRKCVDVIKQLRINQNRGIRLQNFILLKIYKINKRLRPLFLRQRYWNFKSRVKETIKNLFRITK